jgi:hypothetical protein
MAAEPFFAERAYSARSTRSGVDRTDHGGDGADDEGGGAESVDASSPSVDRPPALRRIQTPITTPTPIAAPTARIPTQTDVGAPRADDVGGAAPVTNDEWIGSPWPLG